MAPPTRHLSSFVRIACSLGLFGSLACAPPKAGTPYPAKEPEPSTAKTETDAPRVQESEPDPGLAHYFDRTIALAPYLTGFPYGNFEFSLRTGKVFFVEERDVYTLKMMDLPEAGSNDGGLDLSAAEAISDVDWSKRSLWKIHHHEASDTLWLLADASNDEQMNLWTLDLKDGSLTQVTQHDYVYGFGVSEDGTTLAYLPRAGKKAPFDSCLRVRDLKTGEEREVVCDDASLRFTWSTLVFSPDKSEVYFNAQVDDDRNQVQLVRVGLGEAKSRVLPITDPTTPRTGASALEGWAGDELLFRANDDGYFNLFAWSRRTKKVRQLTSFDEDLTDATLTDAGVVGVHQTPAGSTLVLVEPKRGKVLERQSLPGSASILGGRGERAFVRQVAPDIVFEAFELRPSRDGFDISTAIALPAEASEDLVACKATAVRIPTFDEDAATKKTRTLHAFLLEPEQPLEDPSQRLALITAFYGGANTYRTFDQILCAAGFTVVSPAVRGSRGFGKEFSGLNDGDLGGDEIVDLFYVAKWLEERTGLPPARIGVYGGSHGGYATMRALTFPPETNGCDASYDFGFGMSHAGFSDIVTFYQATNIPDWVTLESGDPNVEQDRSRMKDRSPLSHVDRLRAPLLLTHGSQDWRVPVDESRQFVRKARELDRPITYVEIEGQGHHIEGLGLQVQTYQARFDFLEAVAKAAPAPAAGESASAANPR